MSTAQQAQFDAIIDAVAAWPQDQRMALIRRLMTQSQPEPHRPIPGPVPRGVPVEEMRGLLKVNGPAPSDEEINRILEDALLEKYG